MRLGRTVAVGVVISVVGILTATIATSRSATAQSTSDSATAQSTPDSQTMSASSIGDTGSVSFIVGQATATIRQGRQIFRFDTFGDEAFWGGALKLHRAIEGSRFGGVGPGVSPRTALAVGLKVDSAALPPETRDAIRSGRLNPD